MPISYEIDVDDVEYLRHDGQPLLARIFVPRGKGPFPATVHLHGGAWTTGDRMEDEAVNATFATLGIAVASLDFRMPPSASYPGSLADINYALRWFKTNPNVLHTTADRIGLMGKSSGGHQAVLTALRPFDPRYSSLSRPNGMVATDASVARVVACWPVISPLGRYHYLLDPNPTGERPQSTDRLVAGHQGYWVTEEAMAEGDPVLILERKEPVTKPSILIVHGRDDVAHPLAHVERFVDAYRAAGGNIELQVMDELPQTLLPLGLSTEHSSAVFSRIAAFIRGEGQD